MAFSPAVSAGGGFSPAAGGSSGELGTSAVAGSLAFGDGPPWSEATLTLSQTGGSYGYARLVASGADPGNYQITEISGEAVGPYDLNDPAAADLLVVAWAGASTTIKIGVKAGSPTSSATVTFLDDGGNTVDTLAASSTYVVSLWAEASALGATSFYSPQDLAIGDLVATNVSFEDQEGISPDAIVVGGSAAPTIMASTGLVQTALSKVLAAQANTNQTYTLHPTNLYGSMDGPAGAR